MSTAACNTDQLRELEDRERTAWHEYHDRIRELAGDEYERAEDESWERLQRELRGVEQQRESLTKVPD